MCSLEEARDELLSEDSDRTLGLGMDGTLCPVDDADDSVLCLLDGVFDAEDVVLLLVPAPLEAVDPVLLRDVGI